MNELDYLKLGKAAKIGYALLNWLKGLPKAVWGGILGLLNWILNFAKKIWFEVKDVVMTFVRGDWKTKVSYVIMGFGSAARGQIFRGI